ncbi:helix-turn-helix domain-containing protein [Baekduia sp. Peel2402]|uniref:helix-turn-helix domain-containing protein n=1 Tax=Baekduia sp. Peel2402 TaxID=3458296 RepID=UPI00403EB430
MATQVDERLAETLRAEREGRGWSIAQLAERSGVSKAMISKVERGEASPTAALLGRLSGALGRTLSELLASAESGDAATSAPRLLRRADQPTWQDPDSRYRRRAVSPSGSAVQVVEVELPRGESVSYPADSYTFIEQQIWVLGGTLTFTEGAIEHALQEGDCLRLADQPQPCTFANRGRATARYAVVISRRS